MPSPFPGMDPYLENPDEWPGFHNSFATHLYEALNRDLPSGYYAQIDRRTEVGLTGGEITRTIRPDVSVRDTPAAGGKAVVLSDSRTISPSVRIVLDAEPAELAFVEIRDARASHEVITLIELLSPSNKRSGRDRRRFLRKRAEALRSRTSLVEIDLLRTGRRVWRTRSGGADLRTLDPQPDYIVTISRAWEREAPFRLEVFPAFLREALPVISVPLRHGESETPLDLQRCFTDTYDAGPYRRGAVDYTKPPVPPLPEEHRDWAAERIAAWLGAAGNQAELPLRE